MRFGISYDGVERELQCMETTGKRGGKANKHELAV
jgi:hypothetical protein